MQPKAHQRSMLKELLNISYLYFSIFLSLLLFSCRSMMDKLGEKTVLLFCKACGCRQLHDVIEELQKLFTERNVKPNVCGICSKTGGTRERL